MNDSARKEWHKIEDKQNLEDSAASDLIHVIPQDHIDVREG